MVTTGEILGLAGEGQDDERMVNGTGAVLLERIIDLARHLQLTFTLVSNVIIKQHQKKKSFAAYQRPRKLNFTTKSPRT